MLPTNSPGLARSQPREEHQGNRGPGLPLAGGALATGESRKQDVERVDFLRAEVADEERRAIGAEAGPGTGAELFGERSDPFEIDQAFELWRL